MRSEYSRLINTKQFKRALAEAERDIYERVYAYCHNSQTAVARLLGVSRGTAIKKLREFGIIEKRTVQYRGEPSRFSIAQELETVKENNQS